MQMYEFKKEKKQELLKGRTITSLANEIGMTIHALIKILNGHETTRKLTATYIVKVCDENAEIEYYFTRKEK